MTVSQLKVAPGVDGDGPLAFSLDLYGSSIPAIVPRGNQLMIGVEFTPPSPGPESGFLLVTSSDSPNVLAAVASLAGDATLGSLRTDTFTVPAPPKKLDLVWILDNDDDLPQIQSVAALLPQLIDALNQAQIDWQMAVTSTDTCDGGSSDLGFFEPCEHCISQASTDALFVTSTTADGGDALVNLFNLFDQPPQANFCSALNGDEHLFDSVADAFSTDNLAGHNAGFMRPEADLAIVVVNGDSEDDAANESGAPEGSYRTSLAQVTALVQRLKPDAGMATVSYINMGAGALRYSQNVGKLVQATNGTEIDSSEAAAVWQNALVDLFASGAVSGAFRLSASPAIPDEIEVYVNGVLVTDWALEPFENEIVFAPASLPAPGSTVTVMYRLECQ